MIFAASGAGKWRTLYALLVDVGVGLPTTIRGVTRMQLLEWARRADAGGFSSLGTIDRLVYGNLEPLMALAAAAAVTERIRLATNILIAPYRLNGALAAKQIATLDHLSGGRLTLGVAVGGREDDFEASGADFHSRGKRFDAMLEQWRRIWDGESFGDAGAIGPPLLHGRPSLLIGGTARVAFERAARFGDGWIMGGGAPAQLSEGLAKTRAAWEAAGREGRPRTMALAYFALGADAEVAAGRYLRDYYAFMGDSVDRIAGSAATSPEAVRQTLRDFAEAGCDELMLVPCVSDPEQVDLLAASLA